MEGHQLVREYLLLGLRFDRLVDGFVDAYTGDPLLRRQVGAEPRPDPAALAARARELRAELPGINLEPERVAFLDAHLIALECSGRKLAGEAVSFVEEVESYFQVRITPGDQDEYRAAHAELSALLPGESSLETRLNTFRGRDLVPPEKLEPVVHALSSTLRDTVRSTFGLPEEEVVEYEIVTDKPWSGFNYYLGGYHSKVAINADLGHRMANLPHLVAHESYPGHHTEHCRKESGLVAKQGQAEQTIFLVNTPQCLMAEGLADLGLHAVIGAGWGRWTQEIVGDLGLRMEGEQQERMEGALGKLASVRQDAALMLHDRGADVDEVAMFLRRWLLCTDARARQMIRFLSDPLWRAYTTTYVEGYRLLRTWLNARPSGQTVAQRYRRLLDEPLIPAGVRAEIAADIPAVPRVG
ncbi:MULTISPECIES: DUF885 domain-containing protein [unclassified Crossiella]|uniref:DUF885 domain-containing protein n=1 Tax=unclassified Crossiella TaxID=2620835 RepID=UPI001FFFC388|nr:MULTISPECIES: DUF885 domain-containing protein [unclassified Crossiella]MCK2237114.1 DUF885 domain-containing protein [Crossiella sp. S99.2]MCK2250782.1 DUF885 domain-containing protein [Crossiella sp. S99.1]